MPSARKKPIVIAIPHLRTGGAERQAMELANDLRSNGSSVKIVLLETRAERDLPDLNPMVFDYPKLRIESWRGTPISLTRAHTKKKPQLPKRTSAKWRLLINLAAQFGKILWRKIPWSKVAGTRLCLSSSKAFFPQLAFVQDSSRDRATLLRCLLTFPGMIISLQHLDTYLRNNPVQVVVSFLPKPNIVALIAGRYRDVPVVVSERNDMELNPAPQEILAAQNVLYPHAALLTANSPQTVGFLKTKLPDSNVAWLPNGLGYRDGITAKSKQGDSPNACIISRLEPQKGIEIAIRAWASEWARTNGLVLNIFGSGSQEHSLRKLAEELGLNESVVFHGNRSIGEIDFDFFRIGIFISSSYFEGSSNALHEAVSVGLIPIVRSSVREFQEIVGIELAEKLVFRADEKDLVKKLRALANSPAEASKIKASTIRKFKRYHTTTRAARSRTLAQLASF